MNPTDPLQVLVVDDDEGIRDLLLEVFREEAWSVVLAEDGESAIRAAKEDRFDAALVDHQIPGPDGVEVLRRLRVLNPRCIRILMSGHVDLPVALDAVNRGEAARVVPKPFDPIELVPQIRDAVSSRRYLEELSREDRDRSAETEIRLLNECFEENRLALHYQPILRGEDRSIAGYEGLLRSTHPELRTPLEVLDLAERHGRLAEIAETVTACAASALATLNHEMLLFLNLHPAELTERGPLLDRLERLDGEAGRVVLEITERADVGSIPDLHRTVEVVTGRGFRIAVDDVGAGYSSLSVLANLQPHYIKVDRSIVSNLDREPQKERIVSLLALLARTGDASLIAEGVEREEEAHVLGRCGAHYMQGWLFGKAEPL